MEGYKNLFIILICIIIILLGYIFHIYKYKQIKHENDYIKLNGMKGKCVNNCINNDDLPLNYDKNKTVKLLFEKQNIK